MITEENLQDLFELAEMLSDGDIEVYLTMKDSVFATEPEDILASLEAILSPQLFDRFLDQVGDSEKDNLWLILLYLLEQRGYLCVLNWRTGLEQFSRTFDQLRSRHKLGISLVAGDIDLQMAGPIPVWCQLINDSIDTKNYLMAGIDMESDDYYLFLCPQANFSRVQELTGRLGYRVDLAQNV